MARLIASELIIKGRRIRLMRVCGKRRRAVARAMRQAGRAPHEIRRATGLSEKGLIAVFNTSGLWAGFEALFRGASHG